MMRSLELRGVILVVLTAGMGLAGLLTGCAGDETGTGGAGGTSTHTTPPEPDCPTYEDAGPNVIVTPTAEDDTVCEALAARSRKCDSECPPEPHERCVIDMACLKKSMRPDSIDAIYGCLGTVPCTEDSALIGICAAQFVDEYPPTEAQLAYEDAMAAFAVRCDIESPCAGGLCGGMSDAYYEALKGCATDHDDCFSAGLCFLIVDYLMTELPCTDLGLGGLGGAGGAGGGGGAGGAGGGGAGETGGGGGAGETGGGGGAGGAGGGGGAVGAGGGGAGGAGGGGAGGAGGGDGG